MSESEAQIWCETGQLMVNLPKQAFDKSLTSSGATITPCDGCSHSGHVKKVIQIESEVETATEFKIDRKPHLSHRVSVTSYLGSATQHVLCTCNCYTETVKKK